MILPRDGSWLQARQTGLAGLTDPSRRSDPYLLDTQAPAAPMLTGPTGCWRVAGPAQQVDPAFTITGTGGRLPCAVLRDGVLIRGWQAGSSPFTLPLAATDPDGSWDLVGTPAPARPPAPPPLPPLPPLPKLPPPQRPQPTMPIVPIVPIVRDLPVLTPAGGGMGVASPGRSSPVARDTPSVRDFPGQVGDTSARTATDLVSRPALPLALRFVVVMFLLVQNRIDRRDPKLAAAPVEGDPELGFGPIYRPSAGPATA